MIENFLNLSDDIALSCFERIGLAWWIELMTESPDCVYYFGPFLNTKSAQKHLSGYVEDLEQEQAIIVSVKIQQSQPAVFTLEPENLEALNAS